MNGWTHNLAELPSDQLTVMVVEDDDLTRRRLDRRIERSPLLRLVASIASGAQARDVYRQECPDVVLVDYRLPDLDGVGVVAAIKEEDPEARVVILTQYAEEELCAEAIRAGAVGFLLKHITSTDLVSAICHAHRRQICDLPVYPDTTVAGGHWSNLGRSAQRVLRMLSRHGELKQWQMAAELCLSYEGFRSHTKKIYAALGAAGAEQAVEIARRQGFNFSDSGQVGQ